MSCLGFLNCFFTNSKPIEGHPSMEQMNRRVTNRYSIRPSLAAKAMEEMKVSTNDETLNLINPFETTVQCTVSAKSAYPTKKDRVSYKFQSIQKNYLKFKQGDQICVLGKDINTQMFIGYLELDSSKTVGYFAPNLVYADLTFITPVMVNPHANNINSAPAKPTKTFSTRKISFNKQNQGYHQI